MVLYNKSLIDWFLGRPVNFVPLESHEIPGKQSYCFSSDQMSLIVKYKYLTRVYAALADNLIQVNCVGKRLALPIYNTVLS